MQENVYHCSFDAKRITYMLTLAFLITTGVTAVSVSSISAGPAFTVGGKLEIYLSYHSFSYHCSGSFQFRDMVVGKPPKIVGYTSNLGRSMQNPFAFIVCFQ